MLESLAANLLNRFLGAYVANLNYQQLNIAIWTGEVILRNLQLKKEALEKFSLPVDVKEGHLGELTMFIPWSNLKGQPVKININDVYLLAAPKAESSFNAAEEEEGLQRRKQEKLTNWELLSTKSSVSSQEEDQKNASFLNQLITKIADNLQISIKNIHIRYEDRISTPGHPFSVGLTLSELSAVSTDEEWSPMFIEQGTNTIHKLVTLGSLAVYWNTDSRSLEGMPLEEAIKVFMNLIATSGNIPEENQYVLKPVSGTGKVKLHKRYGREVPKTEATLLFEELGFVIDDEQYRDALLMASLFHSYMRQAQYRKLRPPDEITPTSNPSRWFKYAGDCIISEIHERNRRWTWDYIRERRDDRREYIALYTNSKLERASEEDLKRLRDLEWKWDFEDIRFFRSLAKSHLKKARVEIAKREKEAQEQARQNSWFGWWYGSQIEGSSENDAETVVSEQQKQEFYEAIEWDERQAAAEAIEIPEDAIRFSCNAKLKTGSFSLRKDPHQCSHTILSLVFDDLSAGIIHRESSFKTTMTLGDLTLNDGTTEGTVYPQLIRVKEREPEEERKQMEIDEKYNEPFFSIIYEHNPINKQADNSVSIRMRHLEIIYNVNAINSVYGFFTPPEHSMESINTLLEMAGDTFQDIKQQTRASLEFVLEEHRTINLHVDMDAPVIIIPENCTNRDTMIAVLDAGHINITSDLVEKSAIDEIKKKQGDHFSEVDAERLESFMYDRFNVELSAAQLLVGHSFEACLKQIREPDAERSLHVLEKISISFVVALSILPQSPYLTRCCITGNLPLLRMNFSDRKYKTFLRLLDIIIPKTEEGKSTNIEMSTGDMGRKRQGAKRLTFMQENKPIWEEEESEEENLDMKEGFKDIMKGSGESRNEKRYIDNKIPNAPRINQKLFEFSFEIEKFTGSLREANDADPNSETVLAELILDRFGFSLIHRPYDTSIRMTLKDLVVEDLMVASGDIFGQLVTSQPIGKESGCDKDRDLVEFLFTNLLNDSPELTTKYDGYNQNIDIALSTINIIVTRDSILTLYNFILNTFATPDSPQSNSSTEPSKYAQLDRESKSQPQLSQQNVEEIHPGKFRIRTRMESVNLILNNDGQHLATAALSHGNISVITHPNYNCIRVKLGDFTLNDDINSSAPPLITFQQGEEDLADLSYESYDSRHENYPGYDTSLLLRIGTARVLFIEDSVRQLLEFFGRFAEMKTFYDNARERAIQSTQHLQDTRNNKFHFDILWRAPVVVFPKHPGERADSVVAHLGELTAVNGFVAAEDELGPGRWLEHTRIGLKHIRLRSEFFNPRDIGVHSEGAWSSLNIIEDVDIELDIMYAERIEEVNRPDREIIGQMSEVRMNLDEKQYCFLLDIANIVTRTFYGSSTTESEHIKLQLDSAETDVRSRNHSNSSTKSIGESKTISASKIWTSIDFNFQIPIITLEIFRINRDLSHETGTNARNSHSSSLSRLWLSNTDIKLKILTDSSMNAEFKVQSLNVNDTRQYISSQYREIMPAVSHEGPQFMANVQWLPIIPSSGEQQPRQNVEMVMTIDSPKVIFALDYIFSLKNFFTAPFTNPQAQEDCPPSYQQKQNRPHKYSADQAKSIQTEYIVGGRHSHQHLVASQSPTGSFSYRFNIVDMELILIDDAENLSSDAFFLSARQMVLSQQHELTSLKIDHIGMFLCRMDMREETTLRLIEGFDIVLSMETRLSMSSGLSLGRKMTNIVANVQPLIFRLSYRDMMLILGIINKAAELQLWGDKHRTLQQEKKNRPLTDSSKSNKLLDYSPLEEVRKKHKEPYILTSTETFKASFESVHIILIGDFHELPMVDIYFEPFNVKASNWSGEMRCNAQFSTYANFFNIKNSQWEPLLEPYTFDVNATRTLAPDCTNLEILSRDRLDINISHTLVETAFSAFMSWDKQKDVSPRSTRGPVVPYLIRNRTGCGMFVWSNIHGNREDTHIENIPDEQDVPWKFDDWRVRRENTAVRNNMISLQFDGAQWESVKDIPVDREGEYLYVLRPKTHGVSHRLVCEIKIQNNIKVVTFRATLVVENCTHIPVEMVMVDAKATHISNIYKIVPGGKCPVPISLSYHSRIRVRPEAGFGYGWCGQSLYWHDLTKENRIKSVLCMPIEHDDIPFRFQVHGSYNKLDPLAKRYPYMTIRLFSPLEIENLLPYDIKLRVVDKTTKHDFSNHLQTGGSLPLHVVETSHLLLMSVNVLYSVYRPSEFAIISTTPADDLDLDKSLVLLDPDGLKLNLDLHYFEIPDSGGALKLSIACPYVMLNKTGLDMAFMSKTFLQAPKFVAGQRISNRQNKQQRPFLFSYPKKDHRNRALIQVGNSQWSEPLSFEAVETAIEVVIPSSLPRSEEVHIGVTVHEGQGRYKLCKVITFTPRFILQNHLDTDLNFREPGTASKSHLPAHGRTALHFLRQAQEKQLVLQFPGLNNPWSAPFNIQELGRAHIKLVNGNRSSDLTLMRCEILLEEATVFIVFSKETEKWPFRIDNNSSTEVIFYQQDPHASSETYSGVQISRAHLPQFSLSPNESAQYSWDYPAAKHKVLVLNVNGRERHINFQEIGSLIPFRYPTDYGYEILAMDVIAEGPTQVLKLSNYTASASLYRPKLSSSFSSMSISGSSSHSREHLRDAFEVVSIDSVTNFRVLVKLAGIGISLINKSPQELLYATLRDVEIKYDDSTLYQSINLVIRWIQIDNQLFGGLYPILLYPSIVPQSGRESESHPTLHGALIRVKDESHGVMYLKYCSVLLQEISFEMDEDFLFALVDFTKLDIPGWNVEPAKLCDENMEIPEPKLAEGDVQLYFEVLHIQPIKLNISFVRTERINVTEGVTTSHNPVMFFLNVLTMAIGNINDAPIRLDSLIVENVRVTAPVLFDRIRRHYGQEFFTQVHKIIGSADLLGNPVGLFNNVSSGVAAMFYEPYQGFIMTDRPQDLGIGLAKGTANFFKKTVYGLSDSVSKITGSVGKGLSAATMDKAYQDRRRMAMVRNRPKHAIYGVTQGANQLVSSFASGVAGIVQKPIEGAETEGVGGFFKGIGKGLIGAVTKPVVGVLDLASNVSEGIRNTTTVFDANDIERVRLPRHIGRDRILRPYSQREALGQSWLKELDNGHFFNEKYVAHCSVRSDEVVALLTATRLMLVRTRKLTVEWEEPFKELQSITLEPTGIAMQLRGGEPGPFLPIPHPQCGWFYQKIEEVIRQHNADRRPED
ncbi:uncharacterized protein VTP21DRAFT_7648 [Calcarisporiella thermophila]|uniref:uncharacterized protein n=1 Tax=Calcarisporiella thermophila TaxID=911321 RepID=UPI0037434DAA